MTAFPLRGKVERQLLRRLPRSLEHRCRDDVHYPVAGVDERRDNADAGGIDLGSPLFHASDASREEPHLEHHRHSHLDCRHLFHGRSLPHYPDVGEHHLLDFIRVVPLHRVRAHLSGARRFCEVTSGQ